MDNVLQFFVFFVDVDSLLLEGLFELVVNGQIQGWEFDQIDNEVYVCLLSIYGVDS